MTSKSSSKTSIITIAIIVLVVLGVFVAWKMIGATSDSGYAIIHCTNGEDKALPLNEDIQLTVQSGDEWNRVVIEDGSVFVEDANCPNHDCMGQGKINEVGQQIVCLPHKMWIEISEDENGSGQGTYDTVTS